VTGGQEARANLGEPLQLVPEANRARGGSHNRSARKIPTVPRHREVNDSHARRIHRDLGIGNLETPRIALPGARFAGASGYAGRGLARRSCAMTAGMAVNIAA
jgi:hypothetical protein